MTAVPTSQSPGVNRGIPRTIRNIQAIYLIGMILTVILMAITSGIVTSLIGEAVAIWSIALACVIMAILVVLLAYKWLPRGTKWPRRVLMGFSLICLVQASHTLGQDIVSSLLSGDWGEALFSAPWVAVNTLLAFPISMFQRPDIRAWFGLPRKTWLQCALSRSHV